MSPRCQLAVSNVKDEPISNVVLTLGGVTRHASAELDPHSEAYYEPTRTLPDTEATVTWKNSAGETLSKRVSVERKLGRKFRGKVYFQINKDDTVQVFVAKDSSPKQAVMPWAKPENWEGTVGIPGLTGQEDL